MLSENYNNVPVKKMINPVTSTMVATKGAEEEAGSAPNLFNKMGSILPIREAQRTTPIKEKVTVNPIKAQCGP